MALTPIANLAMRASNRQVRPGQEVAAVVASTDPMRQAIEAQSGMAPGVDVLTNNLYTDSGQADNTRTYFEALSRALPQYINAYRAYQEDLKKKQAAAAAGAGMTGINPDYGTQQPPTVMQNMGVVPDVVRNTWYVTSPYGAMPYKQPTPTPSVKPMPARTLAQKYLGKTMKTAL